MVGSIGSMVGSSCHTMVGSMVGSICQLVLSHLWLVLSVVTLWLVLLVVTSMVGSISCHIYGWFYQLSHSWLVLSVDTSIVGSIS